MRKILIVITVTIALLLALVWPYLIFGQKNCRITELGLSLQLPGNGYLLTRSVDRSGAPLDLYKFFKQTDIDAEFKKADIYLQARYSGFEIQIDAFADFGTAMLSDLDKLTAAQLQEVLQSFAEQYQGDQVSLYKTANATYIAIDYQDKKLGDSYTTKSYMTIKNGKLINIALICQDKQSVAERTTKLQQIVDSIHYT